MTNFASPPDGTLSKVWSAWFNSAGRTLNYLTESGTFANRPTKGLYRGRPYYATDKGSVSSTNGSPIYFSGNYSGTTPIWVYADGTTVV